MTKAVEVLRVARSICELLAGNDIKASDVRYLDMYDDWCRLRGEGHKFRYIVYYLSTQYDLSESNLLRIVRRMDKEVEM